jgi:hypothetical protein
VEGTDGKTATPPSNYHRSGIDLGPGLARARDSLRCEKQEGKPRRSNGAGQGVKGRAWSAQGGNLSSDEG